ncbi:MAG: type I 3-dehydroquinate dehydratase [Anaerolineae bacterium]|nr:type I 3-dehydroquinate dehydratase [Anaerolineae bacterium]
MARPLIAVSIGARDTDEALWAMDQVARAADAAEIRLDLMNEYDLPTLLRHRPCPVIITNRPKREGGRFQGDESQRIRALLQAMELGAEHVDVEWDAVHMVADVDRGHTKLIVSRHDFERMPTDFSDMYDDLAASGADIVKLVGMSHQASDMVPVFRVLRKAYTPTIAIAMGAAGMASRILALRHPSCYLTYATLDEAKQVAPGQVSIADLRAVYHVQDIDTTTRAFGHLAPEPPAREFMAMGNGALRAAGLNAVWVPLVTPSVDAHMLHTLDALGLTGCSVDARLSEGMITEGLHLTDDARRAGQVNILSRRADGRWTGHYLPSDAHSWADWWADSVDESDL